MRIGKNVLNGQDVDVTLKIANGTQEGDAVTLTADGTAGRGTDGDPLYGKVLKIENDGYGTVRRRTTLDLTYTGTFARGLKTLQVDGAGKVKVASSGTGLVRWVLATDATTTTACIDL